MDRDGERAYAARPGVGGGRGWPKRLILTSDLSDYPQALIENADFVVSYSGAVIKNRHGNCGISATDADRRTCKTLGADEARTLIDEAAWRGEPPAEGTRRRIILEAVQRGDVLSDTEALEIADTVESALRRSYGTDDDLLNAASVADRMQEEMDAAVDVLDQLEIPQEREGAHLDLGARVTELGDRYVSILRLVDPQPGDPPETVTPSPIHLQLDAAGIRRFDDEGTPEQRPLTLQERVEVLLRSYAARQATIDGLAATVNAQIDHLEERVATLAKRDDAWVSEVAYQAAGAGTRPLLEDHPDYVFPSERVRAAVAELLHDFGIPRACADCASEQIEHGRKEVGDRDLSSIAWLEDRVQTLTSQREDARVGEDSFKAQRDAALHLLRWLIGDIIPPDLVSIEGAEKG